MLKLIITVLRLGDHQFYGPGSEFVLDTTKPFTVVTQVLFHCSGGDLGGQDSDTIASDDLDDIKSGKSENICSS